MSKVYEVITDRIIELLEKGTVPWHRPWGGPEDFPKNLVSGKNYRGINAFLLGVANYDSPYWLTFKQAKARGGTVQKGEKGYPCIFWNWIEQENEKTGETTKTPFSRYYTVFNVEQCENVPYPQTEQIENEILPITKCEGIVNNMSNPPTITHGGMSASYRTGRDVVNLPERAIFESAEAYYSTLYHELTHCTGHKSRLNRPEITKRILFGSRPYSMEELTAEMGATFLCGHAGIENLVIDSSASYIASWLSRLRKDNRIVVQAAARAQKAADYILGKQYREDFSK